MNTIFIVENNRDAFVTQNVTACSLCHHPIVQLMDLMPVMHTRIRTSAWKDQDLHDACVETGDFSRIDVRTDNFKVTLGALGIIAILLSKRNQLALGDTRGRDRCSVSKDGRTGYGSKKYDPQNKLTYKINYII